MGRANLLIASKLTIFAIQNPVITILVCGSLGAVLATYPVALLDQSFVSPTADNGVGMLYRTPPFVPGASDLKVWDSDGADIGAGLWQNLPYSFIQYRALFQDHEVPLWNRHNGAGRPLLGQGLSQLLDPLQLFPIFAGGNAWGWDIKFVLARALFGIGIGLLVLRTTSHLPSAIAMSISSSFLGYFLWRFSHPAYFAPIFAPWIMLSWVLLLQSKTRQGKLLAWAALVATSVAQIGTGQPKEATITLLIAHLGGFLVLLFSGHALRRKIAIFFAVIIAGAITLCIAAPQWLVFYDTLGRSATLYDAPAANFAKPSQFVRVFLGRLAGHLGGVAGFNPFVLLTLAWALINFRSLIYDRVFVAFAVVGGASLGIAFGLVPSGVILAIPFINNIYHIADTFICASLTPLFVVAGFGMREMWRGYSSRRFALQLAILALALIALVVSLLTDPAYDSFTGRKIALGLTLLATLSLPVLLQWSKQPILFRGTWIATAVLALVIMHFPLGLHLRTNIPGASRLWFEPGQRPDYYTPSSAVEYIRSWSSQPYRAAGIESVMMAGTQSIYGLEGICGPDPLFTPHYEELINALGFFRTWPWLYYVRGRDIPGLDPALDMLGVRFLLADGEFTHVDGLLPTHHSDLIVFERPRAWPRAFYSSSIRFYQGASEVAQMAYANPGRPFAAVERSDAEAMSTLGNVPAVSIPDEIVSARDYRLSSNSTRFNVRATGPGMVVLMETFSEGQHRVSVNGVPTSSVRLNHAFIGIPITSAGDYDVTVKFEPAIWPLARDLSIIGSLCWFLIIFGGIYLHRTDVAHFSYSI